MIIPYADVVSDTFERWEEVNVLSRVVSCDDETGCFCYIFVRYCIRY
jgi:hypothetical protein